MADSSVEETDLVLRPANPQDAAALADLFIAARRAAHPAMPHPVHSPEEIHAWFGRLLGGEREIWLAERGEEVVGHLVLDETWLDSIYVRPGLTGGGIGTVLLDLAKSLRPDGFGLWVFETNDGARRFYLRQGLVELRRTDGSGNEEREPDIEMAWLGADPVAALRRWVDAVDDQVAELLERRDVLSGHLHALTSEGPDVAADA